MTNGGKFSNATPTPTQDTACGMLDINFADYNIAMVRFDFPAAGESGNFGMNRVLDGKDLILNHKSLFPNTKKQVC